MSLKDQFESARAYISAGDYDNARRILRKVDHPKAKEWLERLDRQHPPKRSRRRLLYGLLAVLVVLMICSIAFYMTQIMPESSRELQALLTRQAVEYGN